MDGTFIGKINCCQQKKRTITYEIFYENLITIQQKSREETQNQRRRQNKSPWKTTSLQRWKETEGWRLWRDRVTRRQKTKMAAINPYMAVII